MKFRGILLALGTVMSSHAAIAETNNIPDNITPEVLAPQPRTLRLLSAENAAKFRTLFDAIRGQRWAEVPALLDAAPKDPLTAVARAEFYTAKGSPKVDLDSLVSLLNEAPNLPHAEQLARMAKARGATSTAALPGTQRLTWLGGPPRRDRLDSIAARDPQASGLYQRVVAAAKADRSADADAMVETAASGLNGDSLAELRYIVAWSYYGDGDDVNARSVAARAATGSGPWATQAHWIQGLAAWRQQDCRVASGEFATIARGAADPDLRAAGYFWSARSDIACGQPQGVQAKMRMAARYEESFYSLLAMQYLGMDRPAGTFQSKDSFDRDLMREPNVRAAVEAIDIGESELADRLLRQQVRIGQPSAHGALVALARQLDLANTQLWLSQNGPAGAHVTAMARYPIPAWNPSNGWRIDRALILAHSLEESKFRPGVVSPAGAQGLMQVMPGTAALIARKRGETVDRGSLKSPSVNLEFGQSYIEQLRDSGDMAGLLPKVIAAYNAGPGAVAKWNYQVNDRGDPLLYVESIPYWETRNYVMVVLRNYWMYQKIDGKQSASLAAMAQGLWPRFPGMPGKTAMRMQPSNRVWPIIAPAASAPVTNVPVAGSGAAPMGAAAVLTGARPATPTVAQGLTPIGYAINSNGH